jgi:threonine dehydratase
VTVEPQTSACLHAALGAGRPVDVPVSGVAADSLGARRVGETNWAVLGPAVAQSVVVADDAIRSAQRELWRELRLVAEPGGATALAGLLSGEVDVAPTERVGVLVCGANTDPATVAG